MLDRLRGFEVAFTGTVALFTVVLAIVSIKQQETARKALRRATRSADAAKIATDAAVKQANIADEAMRIGLRPYIQVGDADGSKIAEWVTENGTRIGIKVHFWNAGSTPGSRLRVNGATDPGVIGPFHHLEMRPVRTKYGGTSWTGGFLISARGAASVPINSIDAPQIEKGFADVKKSKQIFEIDGNFEYMNVFKSGAVSPTA
jgi:hypothetical protein